jgi:hypothetical protein
MTGTLIWREFLVVASRIVESIGYLRKVRILARLSCVRTKSNLRLGLERYMLIGVPTPSEMRKTSLRLADQRSAMLPPRFGIARQEDTELRLDRPCAGF